jgi:hypothetical protein
MDAVMTMAGNPVMMMPAGMMRNQLVVGSIESCGRGGLNGCSQRQKHHCESEQKKRFHGDSKKSLRDFSPASTA